MSLRKSFVVIVGAALCAGVLAGAPASSAAGGSTLAATSVAKDVRTVGNLVQASRSSVGLSIRSTPVIKSNGKAYSTGWVRAGRSMAKGKVTIQRLTSKGWRKSRSGTLSRTGSYSFQVRSGSYTYRAVVKKRGKASRSSARVRTAGWALTWRDEFSNDAASRRTWKPRDVGARYGNRKCSTTRTGQTTYPGGVMRLRVSYAGQRSGCSNGSYYNAMVDGQLAKKFTYGVFAARVKFQAPQGMHGAFWMQSARGPEIDVAEYFGNKSKDGIASFLHSRPNSKGRITSVGGRRATANKMLNRNGRTPASGYHVYTVDWTPAGYVFRVDGVETMRTTKLRSKDPHFLVLSLLASDWEIPKIKRSQLSKAYMDVDWVRVWQSK